MSINIWKAISIDHETPFEKPLDMGAAVGAARTIRTEAADGPPGP
jgi:hypothetical protein